MLLFSHNNVTLPKLAEITISITAWKTTRTLAVSVAVVKCGYKTFLESPFLKINLCWIKSAPLSTSLSGPLKNKIYLRSPELDKKLQIRDSMVLRRYISVKSFKTVKSSLTLITFFHIKDYFSKDFSYKRKKKKKQRSRFKTTMNRWSLLSCFEETATK